jgi:hypothetical protein
MNEQRFDQLFLVLKYDSYGEKLLTDFDRMFVHKERGSILGRTGWKVPEDTEKKIRKILNTIERLQWESPY